jgi:DNA-binding beta-propeller fold protein YncE
MKRLQYLGRGGLALLCTVFAIGAGLAVSEHTALAQGGEPLYRNVPLWPRPFADDSWVIGSVTDVTVDSQNHVWVAHRGNFSLENNERGMIPTPGGTGQPSSSVCCMAAPYILEYDVAGTLLSSWGGSSSTYVWPQAVGGIAVDRTGNVWITAAGMETPPATGRGRGGAGGRETAESPPADAHVLKFTRDGRHLMTIGTAGKSDGPDSRSTLDRPSAVAVDDDAREVFVADMGNRRVVVFDSNTGAYKRHWFAYGERSAGAAPGPYSPTDKPARSFRDLTCIELTNDGQVFVCDKSSNRIQVFDTSGKFLREAMVAPNTLGGIVAGGFGVLNAAGAVWDIAFSSDSEQQYVLVADGANKKVHVLSRSDLAEIGSFGAGGRYPGLFLGLGSVATDSQGNVYTGENHHGKRVQKFVPVR